MEYADAEEISGAYTLAELKERGWHLVQAEGHIEVWDNSDPPKFVGAGFWVLKGGNEAGD